MKATGIVRNVDSLGRIVIPKELRDTFDIGIGSAVEFYVDDGGYIVLGKSHHKCFWCGSDTDDNMTNFKGKELCSNCIESLKAFGKSCK